MQGIAAGHLNGQVVRVFVRGNAERTGENISSIKAENGEASKFWQRTPRNKIRCCQDRIQPGEIIRDIAAASDLGR